MTRLFCITFTLASLALAGTTTDYTATTNQCTSFKSCSDWHAYSESSTIDMVYVTNITGWTSQANVTGTVTVKLVMGQPAFTDFQANFTNATWTVTVGGTASYPTYTGVLSATFTSHNGITGKITHTIYNHAVKMGRGPMVRQSLDFGGTVELTTN